MNTTQTSLWTTTSALLISTCLFVGAQEAEQPSDFMTALTTGETDVNLRLRIEGAEQDNGKDDATAATARLRLKYETAAWLNLSAGAEFEGTRAADNNGYNAAGVSGNTNKAVIADPASTEINQAYLKYEMDPASLVAGRQRIVRGNARYVGDVGWRQNQQTFDAINLEAAPLEGLNASYAYVDQVNRIFGSEATGAQKNFKGDIHLLDLTLEKAVTVGAYLYELDIDNAAVNASTTYGAYLAGDTHVMGDQKLAYRVEIAQQSDTGDNPMEYDALYAAGSLKMTCEADASLILGVELLGSDDGMASFQTPLATLHKFNGWADVFLTTPKSGLIDYYVGIDTPLPGGLKGQLFYHYFDADEGSDTLGSEIDALLAKPLNKNAKVVGKLAHYMEDDFGVETTRYSLQLDLMF